MAEMVGELSSKNWLGITEVAANMAAHGMVVTDEDNELRIIQPFENLKHPDQYLLREAFDDFARTHNIPERLTTRAFAKLLFRGKSYYERGLNGNLPEPYPGLEIESRKRLGIISYQQPEYGLPSHYASRYGINAGSLVDALLSPKIPYEETVKWFGKTSIARHIVFKVVQELNEQLS